MKMTPQHFTMLAEAIAPLDTPERREAYRTGNYPRADRTVDVNVRYRWDLFWRAHDLMLTSHPDKIADFFRSNYFQGHIDTALRKIVPVLDTVGGGE